MVVSIEFVIHDIVIESSPLSLSLSLSCHNHPHHHDRVITRLGCSGEMPSQQLEAVIIEEEEEEEQVLTNCHHHHHDLGDEVDCGDNVVLCCTCLPV